MQIQPYLFFKGFALSIDAAEVAAADRMLKALADGGKVTMPIGTTFWSPHFGMVTDRFGLGWMATAAPR